MSTYSFDDDKYINSLEFQEFMKENPSRGFLKIRAYSASGAIPVSGLKVVVSTKIINDSFIFFEGYTNESGIIDSISLPTPRLDTNNLDIPKKVVYEIKATYIPDNTVLLYEVNMYENVYVVQNINIIPKSNIRLGDI